MEITTWLRQGILFAHALAFGVAIAAVLREDAALLRHRAIDAKRLARTGRTLAAALMVLWLSGLTLIALDVGGDFAAVADRPKLVAKLAVVSALTLNGLLLHRVAFPMLGRVHALRASHLLLCTALGAFSTISWLYAAFIGLSRVVAESMSLADFMSLYGLLLLAAGAVVPVLATSMRSASRPAARLRDHPHAG
ncbi:hypothetical protein [Piscinibacter sp. XHJ-5]|uniref:hypothetical protein n=1 Tax=Piscinibacter sp. XHJ-5 TaxID=3037797 RepID=UPI0024534E46|nr:hypothetical protein [Piscinibacter sp. XHJ-5]